MKLRTFFPLGLAVLVGALGPSRAQIPVPPPGPEVVLRSGAELDQLLAPIALYPDPLIAQILPAATLPSEVVLADRYVGSGNDLNQIDQQPWDASVKALAHCPAVLKMMDDSLEWTTEVGQAFLNQPADTMNSIQRLRAQALALGNLQTTPQQQIIIEGGLIEIVPASPDVIYVPMYNADGVFAQRPPQPGFFVAFGVGLAIGAWLNHDCDWGHHEVIVWPRDHPRPRDWWSRPPSQRPRPIQVDHPVPGAKPRDLPSQNVTVWHPRSRPGTTATNPSDRGWDVRETRPAPPTAARPAPVRAVPRPTPAPPARPPTPSPRPMSAPQQPPASGALIGIRSTPDTHEFSNRGGQSRQAIAAPTPTPHPTAPPASRGSSGPAQRKP